MPALTESTDRTGSGVSEGRLRICVVTETYPPEVNGVARTVARMIEGLCGRGHEVLLVRPRQSRGEEASVSASFAELLTASLPIPRYPELKVGLPAGRTLAGEWARRRPDVVHLATPGPLAWSALRLARSMGIPAVSEFRTNFHAYSRHYGIGFLRGPILKYLRRFHNRTSGTLVPAVGLGEELERHGFERVSVVARGVDADRFDPALRSERLREGWGAGRDTLVVLGVGRLAMEKNLGLVSGAFDRIRARQRDARLVLVGDGPERAAFERKRPDAVFAGKRFGEDLARHYASADLLVFPSLTETFGNVMLEGMASGLGVLAFDYGAAHEAIESGRNGWTVAYGDERAYLRVAGMVAGDLALIRRVGAAARDTALGRGWDRIIGRMEAIYRGCGSRLAVGREEGRERSVDPAVAGEVGATEAWETVTGG